MAKKRHRVGKGRRTHTFPPGAKVYVDGETIAHVLQAFPEGSTSLLFPHYTVRMGDRRWGATSAVAMNRVGVDKKKPGFGGFSSEEEARRWAAEYDAKHPLGTLEEARMVAEREGGRR